MINPIVQPTSVDVRNIERELTQLWKSAAEPSSGGQAVTRACTLNLVACAPDSRTAERTTETIVGLTRSYPNRAILIINDADTTETRLETWVQANCQMIAPGLPQVCGEQISINASGGAVGQTPSLALSLIVPDLPTVLWCTDSAPFDNALFRRLRTMVDRVIIDTARFKQPERDLIQVCEMYQGKSDNPIRYTISDLNWTRLTPWRELTAQFFDSRVLLPHLYRLDNVVIEYEHDPDQARNRVQALLLAGWLASRLGWKPLEDSVSVEGDLMRLHLRRSAPTVGRSAIRLVTIELRPVPVMDNALDSLASLRLMATDNVLATFTVERTDDPHCARTIAEVAEHPTITRLARVDALSEADALVAELRLMSRDRVYGEALQVAGAFARDSR